MTRRARIVHRLKQSRIPSAIIMSTKPITAAEREAIAQRWAESRLRTTALSWWQG